MSIKCVNIIKFQDVIYTKKHTHTHTQKLEKDVGRLGKRIGNGNEISIK